MNKLLFLLAAILIFVSCKTPESRKPISAKTGSFIDASVERNKKLNAKEEARIQEVISEQKDNDYIASKSGFWYHYNTKVDVDSLKTPNFGDIINYIYNIKTLNGNMIYSKEDIKPQTYAMDQESLFSGLREGLKLMKTGETITFIFPSQKAYGYYGDENKIGSSTPIICEVTVNSITKTQSN
jgi:gliding motility-associated peptidyl-prolyl isomerase